jgi:hypothetical protein
MFGRFKCLPDEECYLNLPDNIVDNNPLDMGKIKEQQETDDALLQHATKYADQYTALSPLITLKTAQQERSMLLSGDNRLLREG